MRKYRDQSCLLILLICSFAKDTPAQTTAFTYQRRHDDGANLANVPGSGGIRELTLPNAATNVERYFRVQRVP